SGLMISWTIIDISPRRARVMRSRKTGWIAGASLRNQAAVDRQCVTGDERRAARAEPNHGLGNFIGPAHPPHRLEADELFFHFRISPRDTVHHLGVNYSGANRVHANAALSVFERS